MQCMKCGREIPAGDVFCENCLADMEKYPVKPGTVVHIPHQSTPPVKRPERRQATVEQRLTAATRTVRILSFALTLTVALLIGVGALAISMYFEHDDGPLPGQNYSTADSATGTSGEDVSRETSEGQR